MKTTNRLLIASAIVAVHLLGFMNCSKVKFSANDQSSAAVRTDTGGPNCRAVLENIQTDVKMIFVIDVSGSNKTTDPNQEVRAGSISRFYESYKAKTNFGWNALSFAATTAEVRLAEGDGKTVNDLITWLQNHDDAGGTPYVAALSGAKSLIEQDPSRNAQTKYVVVFISDGKPDPAVEDSILKAKVEDLVGAVAGRVSFNTVYYGPEDAPTGERLDMMAQAGGGNFLDTNKNSTGAVFSISDLVVVPGEICQ